MVYTDFFIIFLLLFIGDYFTSSKFTDAVYQQVANPWYKYEHFMLLIYKREISRWSDLNDPFAFLTTILTLNVDAKLSNSIKLALNSFFGHFKLCGHFLLSHIR